MRFTGRVRIGAIAAIIAAGCAGQAFAVTVVPPSPPTPADPIVDLQTFPNGPLSSSGKSLKTLGAISSSTADADGSASGAASAFSQYVSVNATGAGSDEGYARASETYTFSVVGPDNGSIPLVATGGGHLYATTGASGYVEISESIGGASLYLKCAPGSSQCGDFTYSQPFSVAANGFTTVTLSAFTVVQDGSTGGWVDPTLAIDPTFADAGLYHIVFSNGISNGPGGAPEPAVWALMVLGVGGVGAALRTRRRSLAA